MSDSAQALLGGWNTFYVLVGSAAGALTGLQFVVMTLISDMPAGRAGRRELDTFATPSVVHFCTALFVAAALAAPWRGLVGVRIALAGCGVAGAIYSVIVYRRLRNQTFYRPVMEDWTWHVVLPLAAYLAIVGATAAMPVHPERGLFVVGAVVVLLLFVGIHNAWDLVASIAAQRSKGGEHAPPGPGGSEHTPQG